MPWRGGSAQGGLEVYGLLELGRKLHREIAWLLAAQDAIHIGGGATHRVCLGGSVGEQATVSGKERLRIDRRYVVSGRRRYDRRAMRDREYSYSLISIGIGNPPSIQFRRKML
jgi:hypothetical protein